MAFEISPAAEAAALPTVLAALEAADSVEFTALETACWAAPYVPERTDLVSSATFLTVSTSAETAVAVLLRALLTSL